MSIWWPQSDDIHAWLVSRGYVSRDWGLLAASLNRPLTTLAGQEMYPSIWAKIAALLDSVERNHPLIDGNKRLGLLLASLVLNSNGISDQKVSDDQWYELILSVASDHLEVGEIASRLQKMLSED
ncbi:MAG: Fic family protein [Scrofimicrobium sp.]